MDTLAIYYRQIRQYPLLSRDEEQELARRKQQGDQRALQALVAHNLRYVVSCALRFRGRGAVELEDLIQVGSVGLMTAARKFNPELGFRLSTYATPYIFRDMSNEAADHSRTIRLPRYISGKTCPPEQREAYYALFNSIGSLQATIDENPLIDTLSGREADPAEIVADSDTQADRLAKLEEYLSRFTPRDRRVLQARSEGALLIEAAAEIGVTRERARQIEMKSLQALAEWFGLEAAGSSISQAW